MEGEFIFTVEDNKEKFIADKKKDIEHYKALIKATEKLIEKVENG